MDGQSSTHGHTDEMRPAVLLGDLTTALVGLLLALEGVIACVLLLRRAVGALAPATSPGWLLAWMALAAVAAATTRLAVGRHADGNAALALASRYLPTVALILTALALTSFRAPWVVFLTWAIVAVEQGAVWLVPRDDPSTAIGRIGLRGPRRWPAFRARSESRSAAPVINERTRVEAASPPTARSGPAGGNIPPAATQFSQRLERVQSTGGADVLAGTLTARVVAGQATANIHVAFCPPFGRVPQLDFRQVAGPTARIKVGQLLPHGVRFDVKLEGPATDSLSICLEMRASHVAVGGGLAPDGNPASN